MLRYWCSALGAPLLTFGYVVQARSYAIAVHGTSRMVSQFSLVAQNGLTILPHYKKLLQVHAMSGCYKYFSLQAIR